MAYAPNFDEKLETALKSFFRKHKPTFDWKKGHSLDERSRVDVAGFKHGDSIPRVLIEVELKKDNPVENVVKAWHWAVKEKIKTRILFVHAFSAHYEKEPQDGRNPKKVRQYERATFIGNQMKDDPSVRIHYVALPIISTTRSGEFKRFKPLMRRGVKVKEGGAAMHRAARNLARQVRNEVARFRL